MVIYKPKSREYAGINRSNTGTACKLKTKTMRATIEQAENNERNLTVTMTGYGHWRIEIDYRGRRISTTTNNSVAVDNFRSEYGEKDRYGRNRIKAGYEALCSEVIRANN